MSEKEIRSFYKNVHNKLSESYYAGKSGLTKEEFDTQHGKVWADMEAELLEGGLIPTPGPSLEDRVALLEARVKEILGISS